MNTFILVSCGGGKTSASNNSSNPIDSVNNEPCSRKNKDTCEKNILDKCVWNVDKCQDKDSANNEPCSRKNKDTCEKNILDKCVWNVDKCQDNEKIYAPAIPKNLGKVKMVTVGRGFCAIDMNDELWCIPSNILDPLIPPHPTKKYRHVAMIIDDSFRNKICATELDGTSICFNAKGEKENGPTQEKVLATIPASYHDTVCAFSKDRLFCESAEKAFEKLDNFSQDPWVQSKAKIVATDPIPSFEKIAFQGSKYGLSDKRIFLEFSNKRLLVGVRDDAVSALWSMAKFNSGAPAIFENVLSFSVLKDSYCIVRDAKKGLACDGGTYHKVVDIPADILNADLAQVATAKDHTCVILKNSGELKCWGAKKKIKGLSANNLDVKQIAVSEEMTCFIDKNDMLNCFGES